MILSQLTDTSKKMEHLKKLLREYAPVAIAFSGGVDSGYLCLIAFQTLGKEAIAVTAQSETFPANELEICQRVVKEIGISHHLINTKELEVQGFKENQVSRCYFCKQELYQKIQNYLKKDSSYTLLDGSIADDQFEQRPGMQAAKDLDVYSPLREAGLTKKEIREHAKELGLSIWDKPALACLSSRIPYGTFVTFENLTKVKEAEKYLKAKNFAQLRVRYYHQTAKIEIPLENFQKLWALKDNIQHKFQELGFQQVVLDLKGFRSGSMHEAFKMIPDESQRESVAQKLWKDFSIQGKIQQNGSLTILSISQKLFSTLLKNRSSLVETFHKAGLPYLTLSLH